MPRRTRARNFDHYRGENIFQAVQRRSKAAYNAAQRNRRAIAAAGLGAAAVGATAYAVGKRRGRTQVGQRIAEGLGGELRKLKTMDPVPSVLDDDVPDEPEWPEEEEYDEPEGVEYVDSPPPDYPTFDVGPLPPPPPDYYRAQGRVRDFARRNSGKLIAMGVGATALGAGAYALHRRNKRVRDAKVSNLEELIPNMSASRPTAPPNPINKRPQEVWFDALPPPEEGEDERAAEYFDDGGYLERGPTQSHPTEEEPLDEGDFFTDDYRAFMYAGHESAAEEAMRKRQRKQSTFKDACDAVAEVYVPAEGCIPFGTFKERLQRYRSRASGSPMSIIDREGAANQSKLNTYERAMRDYQDRRRSIPDEDGFYDAQFSQQQIVDFARSNPSVMSFIDEREKQLSPSMRAAASMARGHIGL